VNYLCEEQKLPDFSHIQFKYFTIENLSPRLTAFNRVLVCQFTGTFKAQAECDEYKQFAWMASLAGYARTVFEADGFVMDVSGMEYQGEMLLDDLMGDVYMRYGDEQHQVNVVSESMCRAVHDRDIDALPRNLQDGLELLEQKMAG
jgi:hypothetical protein